MQRNVLAARYYRIQNLEINFSRMRVVKIID